MSVLHNASLMLKNVVWSHYQIWKHTLYQKMQLIICSEQNCLLLCQWARLLMCQYRLWLLQLAAAAAVRHNYTVVLVLERGHREVADLGTYCIDEPIKAHLYFEVNALVWPINHISTIWCCVAYAIVRQWSLCKRPNHAADHRWIRWLQQCQHKLIRHTYVCLMLLWQC